MMGIISGDKIVELAQASDLGPEAAKQAHIKAVGNISKINVWGNNLLVVTYIGPEKSDGGVIRPKENIKEDEHQGNRGLVVKLGWGIEEDPKDPLLHKWVVFGYNDGLRCLINKVHCRFIAPDRIRADIPDPRMVL